ncbi:MFS transporter [Streptomyces abyssalis]|uniref:MFS transporter n=1 Tax=Streptomyces abyssalis TaxID=933944 RepID=A0A1E7JMB4_9ACTN|nr:MFS transporter [Streptomyces abyssalis]OEU87090.1 MFS transporter [Streptomyces abyssalis]OEU89020.1 MFS transporter [Streptomyces abyssalis]
MPGASSSAGSEPCSRSRRWKALAVCLVAGFMTLLDVSIVNVALPSVREGLHTTESELQWVISGYALSFGLFLVPAGRLGDARGRRRLFMAGLALFTLASAGCGAARTSTWLVAARLVQGLGGGMIAPQISALIQQMFSGRERSRAFGMFGTVVGFSTAVGPLLGGVIIQVAGAADGWRWVFYVNLPTGVVCLLLARRLLPDTPGAGRRKWTRSLDPVGVALLGAAVLAVLLPFVQAQQWRGSGKWLLLAAAALLLWCFVRWESRCPRRETEPVVSLSLFRIRSYWTGCLLILFHFAGFTSIFFITTLYLQSGLRYSALQAGLVITPFALGSGAASQLGGRYVDRYGRGLVACGLALTAGGLAGTAITAHQVDGPGTAWYLMAPLLVAGVGTGLVIAPNQALTLARVPVARGGSAAGVLQTGQRIGAAVGIAGVGSLFFTRLGASNGAPGPADWRTAYQHGLMLSVAFVLVALAAALADVWTDRSAARAARAAQRRGPPARPDRRRR